ncbi:hypothetical protein Tco_0886150 [Tanacetum coccineum]
MSSPALQYRWSQDKHIDLVNIIGNPGAVMLTRAMAKDLSAASAHECLFVDFLSEEEPKKIKQSKRGILINQEKYVKDLLKKYDINGSFVKTPMVPPNNLGPDLNGKAVNKTQYRGKSQHLQGPPMKKDPTLSSVVLILEYLLLMSITQQQGMYEGTQNYSLDHIFARTNPSVLVDKTKSARDGLKTAHTNLGINMESSSAEISKTIKLEDLTKLMQDVKTDFMDLDSLEDEPIFVQDENKEEEEADKYKDTHATSHEETKDSSVPHLPSPRTVQLKELTNQVLLLQSQNMKLEQQKNKAEAEVALLTAQPSYPNVNQLSQLLVNSIKPELSKLLSSYDFNSFIQYELKEISSKFTVLSGEVKEIKKHVVELKALQWELPPEFLPLPSQVSSVQAKLKTLDVLLSLLNKVTDTLNRFAHIMENASPKAGDKGVPLAGQAGASPAEGEKNTNQATIS